MKYFRLIWKNVFRKKTRMALTTGSIVLVLVLIVVLVSLLNAMEADPSGGRGANRLVVQHATGLASFLPLSQRQRIEQIPGVVAVSPQIWFGGVYKDEKPENWFGQLSCDPEVFFKIFDDATIDPAVEKAWRAERNSFVAGKSLEDKFHWKPGDHIILRGTYIPISLDLVYKGSFHAGDESNVFFHNEYLNQGQWFGANRVTGIYYLKVACTLDLAHYPFRGHSDRREHGRDVRARARHGNRGHARPRLPPLPYPFVHPVRIRSDVVAGRPARDLPREVPADSGDRRRGGKDLPLRFPHQLQGHMAGLPGRVLSRGRNRCPGGIRPGDPVLSGPDRRRPAAGRVR